MPGPIGTNANTPVVDGGTLAVTASPLPGPTCATRVAATSQNNYDISQADGEKIVAVAATWKGTPYVLAGASSVKGEKGDCSGSTYKIFEEAGFPYPYQTSGGFRAYAAHTRRFRLVDTTKEALRSGDVLSWPNHMAIYVVFAKEDANGTTARTSSSGSHWTQVNNMWTATHPGGPAYQAAEMRYFRSDPPKVYRYQRVEGGVCAP